MTALDELKIWQRVCQQQYETYNNNVSNDKWTQGFDRGAAITNNSSSGVLLELIKKFEDEQLEATADKEGS